MELIRKLLPKLNKMNHLESFGEFLCPFCLQLVERQLSNGKKAKSCGCPKYRYGEGYGTKLYYIWAAMKQRILNPNDQAFKDYGGRGIIICPEWTDKDNGFIKFRDWSLSNGYANNLQIDRINNNGNYEPSNCRFITNTNNCQNRRSNVIESIEQANEIRNLYNTGNYTQKELALKYNVSNSTINKIVNNKFWRNNANKIGEK